MTYQGFHSDGSSRSNPSRARYISWGSFSTLIPIFRAYSSVSKEGGIRYDDLIGFRIMQKITELNASFVIYKLEPFFVLMTQRAKNVGKNSANR